MLVIVDVDGFYWLKNGHSLDHIMTTTTTTPSSSSLSIDATTNDSSRYDDDNNNTNHINRNEQQQQPSQIIIDGIRFENYRDESQLDHVRSLVGRDLSEPYSSTLIYIFKIIALK